MGPTQYIVRAKGQLKLSTALILGMCRIPDNYPVLSGVFCYIRCPAG